MIIMRLMWSCYLHHGSEGEALPRLRARASRSCRNRQRRDSPGNILDGNIYGAVNNEKSPFQPPAKLQKLLVSNP